MIQETTKCAGFCGECSTYIGYEEEENEEETAFIFAEFEP